MMSTEAVSFGVTTAEEELAGMKWRPARSPCSYQHALCPGKISKVVPTWCIESQHAVTRTVHERAVLPQTDPTIGTVGQCCSGRSRIDQKTGEPHRDGAHRNEYLLAKLHMAPFAKAVFKKRSAKTALIHAGEINGDFTLKV